jgi:hypothetical protein
MVLFPWLVGRKPERLVQRHKPIPTGPAWLQTPARKLLNKCIRLVGVTGCACCDMILGIIPTPSTVSWDQMVSFGNR